MSTDPKVGGAEHLDVLEVLSDDGKSDQPLARDLKTLDSPSRAPGESRSKDGVGTASAPQTDLVKDGLFKDGLFKDGLFKDGLFKDGSSRDGLSKDGSSTDGLLSDGRFKDGVPQDGASGDGALTASFRDGADGQVSSSFAALSELNHALLASGVALWRLPRSGGGLTWDAAMVHIHGRPSPRTLERYLAECVHPDDRPRVEARYGQALETGRFEDRPYRVVRPDGSVRWVLVSGSDPTAAGALVGAMIDVTHHRELDEQLRYSQKMEAIGTLTAGIAHNFNNILMVIMPTLDFVAPMVPERESEFVRGAAHAARRGAELVRHLMTFAGQTWSSRSVQRVDEIVHAAVAIFGSVFDSNAELTVSTEESSASILCDAGDIQQVLVNLLLNARDAVVGSARGRGHITLATSSVDHWLAPVHRPSERRPAVRIQVIDDGRGMTEGVKAKAFEPFFTTKEVGQGTGLGLATCYAIVRDHEGTLSCDSSPGVGTTFSVRLPLAIVPKVEVRAVEGDSLRGLRVLLVDDDTAVRAAVGHVLRDAGIQLLEARGGSEALEILAEHRDVDVVLLDFAMPDGPGARYVPRIRAVAPRSKILFFTGLKGTEEMTDLADGVVIKPVGGSELLRAISRVIVPATRTV